MNDKELLNDYMNLLRADAARVFPGSETVTISIVQGSVYVSATYPDGQSISTSAPGKESFEDD